MATRWLLTLFLVPTQLVRPSRQMQNPSTFKDLNAETHNQARILSSNVKLISPQNYD